MDFISNSSIQRDEMLAAIGAASIEELFSAIPTVLRCAAPASDDGLSEAEGMRLMEEIAARNTYREYDSYLGAGAYDHHVPPLVAAITSKSGFLTAYTPYQPEISQGMLQAIFEFQSAICALTGMDVSNASLYDGSSACAEAALMALRIQKPRTKLLVAGSLHPSYHAVIDQYASLSASSIDTVPFLEDFSLDLHALEELLDETTAALILQSPNVFGLVEDAKEIFRLCRSKGVLAVQCGNPLAYGLFHTPQETDADIAVGDCQPFGLPLNFGGPYAGYIACKQAFMRQLPGRIVGETLDTQGRRGFVLTMQAREQHIRREKATSNVCTNQALAALAGLVAILWYGKEGVPLLALENFRRAAYLRRALSAVKGLQVIGSDRCFNEFVVGFPGRSSQGASEALMKERIIPGLPLGQFYPSLDDKLLVCTTELKSKAQLDRYVEAMARYANDL